MTETEWNSSIEVVGFNMGHLLPSIKQWERMDIVYTLVRNTWLEARSGPDEIKRNLHLIDLRKAQY